MAQSNPNSAIVIDVNTEQSTGPGIAEFKERLADEFADDYDYYIDDDSPIFLAEDIIPRVLVDTMELVCANMTAQKLLDWMEANTEEDSDTYVVNQIHQLQFNEIRIEERDDD